MAGCHLLGAAILVALCHPAFAWVVGRASVSSSGAEADYMSGDSSISADGRFVAFDSRAGNLVSQSIGRYLGDWDVFVHDRQTGQTERVSVSSLGEGGNRGSRFPSISADGRFVAFRSDASNLVSDDTNDTSDIFVRDRQTGQTERVSVSSAGDQGDGGSWGPSISADGRFVAFNSGASNLVPDDTNGVWDVFVHDRQTGLTERVSLSSAGAQGKGPSQSATISADGRVVAFTSYASNLVAGDTNGVQDVFVHDRQTGQTERVSVSSLGEEATHDCWSPSMSADGRFVAFDTEASNLVPGDTNEELDIFVRDRQMGQTDRVSVSTAGTQANNTSSSTSLSADGRFIAFDSRASNLVPDDTNGEWDVFIHDRRAGRTERVSLSALEEEGNGLSAGSTLSADSRFVAFVSDASNLVPGDANGFPDVFVADTHVLPGLAWLGAEGYRQDGCHPNLGAYWGARSPTDFTFKVRYFDPGGDRPLEATCLIEERRCDASWALHRTYAMNLRSGSPDTGAVYSCRAKLPGYRCFRYRFRFRSADGSDVPGLPSEFTRGPWVDSPPFLCWVGTGGFAEDGVDPDSGELGTRFEFRVRCTKRPKELLSHVLRVSRNGVPCARRPMTGRADDAGWWTYRAAVTLRQAGTYTYCFHFQDVEGRHARLGAPADYQPGPILTGAATVMLTSLSAQPAKTGAQVSFALSAAAHVDALVLNVAGRPVRRLAVDRPLETGLRTLLWDRRSDTGLTVPAGLYLVRITARSEDGAQSSGLAPLRLP